MGIGFVSFLFEPNSTSGGFDTHDVHYNLWRTPRTVTLSYDFGVRIAVFVLQLHE